jgi:acyl-CoA thioester hydrolase
MKIRVYYEDTDAGGIVYHTNYVKYCERARSEYLFAQNVMPGEGSDFGFVVKNITADFYDSATLGDMLEVKNRLLHMKSASFVLEQTIYKESIKIFSMDVVLVYMEDGKIKKIPPNFKNLFLNIK